MTLSEALRSLHARTREFVSHNRVTREMDDEFRFHLDAEVNWNIERGMSPAEARRVAMSAFGGVERYRAETRDARGFAPIDACLRDTRLALRRLRRAPTFTLGIIATLAVALGAVTAVGTLVYGVMLRPLPYADADRLVRISILTPGLGVTGTEQSTGTFAFIAERARSFATLAATMENEGVAITEGDAPERVTGAIVTPSLFRVLGTIPAAGRLLRDEDALLTFDSPVLISHDVWQKRYGGNPDIIGKPIELQRRPRTIVGVLPAGFAYPSRSIAIYYPDKIEATRAALSDRNLLAVGRLAPGVSVAQAQTELDLLMKHLHERFPELSADAVAATKLSAKVETLQSAIAQPVRSEFTLLALMAAALLLIATANVATLSLLRAERLRGEIAVSRALGASRGTILRRFMVESVLVSLAGGLLAFSIATVVVARKFGMTDAEIPRLHDVFVTPSVAVALLGVSVLVGLALGAASAARASGGALAGVADTLRADLRTTRGRAWRRAQESLVTIQIAVALTLLLGTGLMASSFVKMQHVEIGFDAAHAAKFSLALPFRAYPTFQRTAAFDLAVIDALRAIPGVTGVGAAMQFPSTPHLLSVHPRIRATRASGRTSEVLVTANVVTADFFRVMRVPLLRGRSFGPGDLASPTPGVILGASLARELFGSEDPVGREVRIASSSRYPAYRVVGVSGDLYGERITDGALRVLYFPLLGDLPPTSTETENRIPFMPAGMSFVVRSELPASVLLPAFRRAVASVDTRVPIWDARTLDSIVAATTAKTRLSMLLLAMAAAATLLLGAIGLYSVIAYSVSGRAREFAVRLAIGAAPGDIVRQVLREATIVAGTGIVAGIGLSLATGRVLRGMLYEVSTTDPATYVAATLTILLCSALATSLPARRAGKTDMVGVLRGE